MNFRAIRTLIVLWTLFLAALPAFSQTNLNIIVPKSSVRKAMVNGVRKAFTNYSIYVGPWSRRSIDDWKAEETGNGPAFQQIIQGYHPADIQAAYKIPASGGAEAIAIIDAFHLPTALNDFNVFASAFGLPQETSTNATSSSNKVFQVVYASGTKPPVNNDWAGEIALDIEWAHAMAPKAKIYLIECASDSFSDLMAGVRYAATQLSDVRQISMSFGAPEFSQETSFDTNFTGATNKVFFASSGDHSNEVNYPAASTLVIGVGGTSLAMSNGIVTSETAWSASGGGPSTFITRPSFQNGVANAVGTRRGTPDIGAIADPETGCAVYISTELPNAGKGWMIFGGTSLAAPVCAGITNSRGQFSASTADELGRQYGALGGPLLRDVTTGKSGLHSAAVGYDFVTGVGVPIGTLGASSTTTFAPTNMAIVSGVAVQGVPANMIAKDAHDYVVRSITSSGQKVSIGGTFQLKVQASAVVSANISITGMTTNATNTLSFLNTVTGLWDTISTPTFAATNKTVTLTVGSLTNYLDAGGNLKFRVGGTSSGAAFKLGIDQIQLVATISKG